MTLLDRYLGRTVVGASLLVLLVLTALWGFVTFIEQLHRIGHGSYGVFDALQYALLTLPDNALDLFPTAALMGALLGLGGLASTNELMVIRTAGVSALRIAASALVGGIVLAVAVALIGEYIAPPAKSYAEQARGAALYGRVGSGGEGGIWARDGDLYINVREMADQKLIRGIYIYRFDGLQLTRATHADVARFENGHWQLHNLQTTTLSGQTEARSTRAASAEWKTLLDPDLLSLFVVDPDNLSAGGLLRYIDYLHHNNLSAKRYETAFWHKVARPVTVLAMVLLAMPFVFGPLRSAATGQRLLVGILTGVAFYLFNTMTAQLGEVFGAPPLAAAWLPTVVLAAVSLFAVSRLR